MTMKIFLRKATWDFENFQTITFNNSFEAISSVFDKLWCVFKNTILVLDPITLEKEVNLKIKSFRF